MPWRSRRGAVADLERLVRIAEGLNIGGLRRHIFLCCDQTEPKCASRETGLASWQYLKRRLAELRLADVYRTKGQLPAYLRAGVPSRWSTRRASGITPARPKCWSGSSRST